MTMTSPSCLTVHTHAHIQVRSRIANLIRKNDHVEDDLVKHALVRKA